MGTPSQPSPRARRLVDGAPIRDPLPLFPLDAAPPPELRRLREAYAQIPCGFAAFEKPSVVRGKEILVGTYAAEGDAWRHKESGLLGSVRPGYYVQPISDAMTRYEARFDLDRDLARLDLSSWWLLLLVAIFWAAFLIALMIPTDDVLSVASVSASLAMITLGWWARWTLKHISRWRRVLPPLAAETVSVLHRATTSCLHLNVAIEELDGISRDLTVQLLDLRTEAYSALSSLLASAWKLSILESLCAKSPEHESCVRREKTIRNMAEMGALISTTLTEAADLGISDGRDAKTRLADCLLNLRLFRESLDEADTFNTDQSPSAEQGRQNMSSHVFVGYSHADLKWLRRLQTHLKPLVREGLVELWDDTRIKPGDEWKEHIETALQRARVAVLLVSADFLASDFVADKELPPLLERAERRGVRILPIIVGHCLFSDDARLSKYQAANSPDRPLATMAKHEAEEVLLKTAKAISDHFRSK